MSREVKSHASYRGVRVGTEASTKPDDQVSLTLWLPKDAAPAAIAVASVHLVKDQVDGPPSKGCRSPDVNS